MPDFPALVIRAAVVFLVTVSVGGCEREVKLRLGDRHAASSTPVVKLPNDAAAAVTTGEPAEPAEPALPAEPATSAQPAEAGEAKSTEPAPESGTAAPTEEAAESGAAAPTTPPAGSAEAIPTGAAARPTEATTPRPHGRETSFRTVVRAGSLPDMTAVHDLGPTARFAVATSDEGLAALWAELKQPEGAWLASIPSGEALVIAYLGHRAGMGHGIRIDGVEVLGSKVVVRLAVVEGKPGAMVSAPVHLVLVDTADWPEPPYNVVFESDAPVRFEATARVTGRGVALTDAELGP